SVPAVGGGRTHCQGAGRGRPWQRRASGTFAGSCLMVSATREEHSYRRGLVLGLTMAEIVTLIIFVLLLALSAVLAHKDDEAERLIGEIARRDQEVAILQEKAAALERFASGNDDIENYFRELVLKRQEVTRLESEKAALVEKAEAAVTEL